MQGFCTAACRISPLNAVATLFEMFYPGTKRTKFLIQGVGNCNNDKGALPDIRILFEINLLRIRYIGRTSAGLSTSRYAC